MSRISVPVELLIHMPRILLQDREKRESLRFREGIYAIFSKRGSVLYIGESTYLAQRMRYHASVYKNSYFSCLPVRHRWFRVACERLAIARLNPQDNLYRMCYRYKPERENIPVGRYKEVVAAMVSYKLEAR